MVKGERRGVVLLRVNDRRKIFRIRILLFQGAYLGIDSEDDSTVRIINL
jgi:hypothetical protein